jgi:hypothetical protein
MADKIEIKIKKGGKKDLKPIKDGPHVRDIKISSAKGPVPTLKETRSRVVKIKEKKDEKKKKFHFKSFIIGLIFVILGLTFEAILGFYFWQDFFSGKNKIARIIPQNTVLYARVDLNKLWGSPSEKQNVEKIAAKFFKTNDFEKTLTSFLNQKVFAQYKLEFSEDIKPLLGKEAALAMIPEKQERGESLTGALIVEINNREKIKEIFTRTEGTDIKEESFGNIKINLVNFPDGKLNFYYTILDNLLVLSKNKEPAFEVTKVFQRENSSLASFKKFRETVPLWSRNASFYTYLNLSGVSRETLMEGKALVNSVDFLPLYVFLKKIESFSFSINPGDNGVSFRGFAPYQNEDSKPLESLDFLPSETAISFAGSNLKKEWLDFSKTLKKEDPVAGLYLENFEQKLNAEYKVNLEEDVLPLVEKEIEIVLIFENGKQNWGLILSLDNQEKLKDKMEIIEKALSHYYGLIYPEEKKLILADGTETIELFPNDKSFLFKEEKFSTETGKGIIIKNIENPDAKNPFAFTIFDDQLIFGTSKNIVEKIISEKLGGKGLTSNSEFNESKKLAGADKKLNGLVYINWMKVFESVGFTEQKKVYFEPLKNLILVSKNKNSGTAISGFLLIK